MRLLISKWPPFLQQFVEHELTPYLGHICIPGDPGNRQILTTGLPLAMLAFTEVRQQRGLIRSLLVGLKAQRDRILFLAPPVCLHQHDLTQAAFWAWRKELHAFGPVGYVVQPHEAGHVIPWPDLAAVVLHGSPRWLHSHQAAFLAHATKAEGKYLHISHITSLADLHVARDMNADSVSLAPNPASRSSTLTMYANLVKNLTAEATREGPPAAPGSADPPTSIRARGAKGGEA